MSNLLKIFIIALLLIGVQTIRAQEFSMQTGEVIYGSKTYPAVIVRLEPDAKAVKKELADFMKNQYNVNLKGIGFLTNKDVLTADKILISSISDKEMDFFAKIVTADELTEMSVFAALGYDIPVSQANDNASFQAMKEMVGKFIDGYLPNYYQQAFDEAKDQVKSLEKDQSDYQKDIAKNEKAIEKLQKENEKLAEKLEETQQTLQKATERRAALQTKLEAIRNQLGTSKK